MQSPEALIKAGVEALEAGRFIDAASCFSRLLEAQPESIPGLCGLSAAHFGSGDVAAALSAAKRAQRLSPQSIPPLSVLAPAAFCAGDQASIALCLDALRAGGETAARLAHFWAQRLVEHERFDEAVAVFDAFLAHHQPDYQALISFAELLLNASHPERARAFISRAIRLQPDQAAPHALNARRHIQTGALGAARADALRAIALDQACIPAYLVLAEADASAIDEEMATHLAALMQDRNESAHNQSLAGFALGRSLESRGDHVKGFDAYAAANAAARSQAAAAGRGYNRRAAEATIEATKSRFPARVFTAPPPAPGRGGNLIFVTGMPRTGSTLIDQILSSHSAATSAGECMALPRVFDAIMARSAQTGEGVAALIDQHADEWEALYRKGLKLDSGAKQVIVDKTLHNFWHYGLIARLFPAAKIIEARRDPMDVGFSIFRLNFLAAHAYSNSLEDIAHAIHCFEELSAYWRSVLPQSARTVVYEELVGDFRKGVADLLDFCGLPLEEGCLDFQRSARPVNTMSAAQVRQGVTTDRRGRWRAYEAQLAPLRRALDDLSKSPHS